MIVAPSMTATSISHHAASFQNTASTANIAAATANAADLLSFLRSLPPPPPPSTPPPPPPLMTKVLQHGLASDSSLDSLETRTTTSSSSSSSCGDDDEDCSDETPLEHDVESSSFQPEQLPPEQQPQQIEEAASSSSARGIKQTTTRLTWGTVQVREYNRTIGDHPDVTYGPPLALDWQYNQHEHVEVDVYEEHRSARQRRILRLSSLTRRNLLANEFLIDKEELERAEKLVQKMQKQRAQSNRQGTYTAKMQDKLKQCTRRLAIFFSNREVLFAALSAASGPSFTGMNSSISLTSSTYYYP